MASAYHEALMRRLGMIDELGANATALMPQRQAPQINMPAPAQYNGPTGAAKPKGGFDAFMAKVAQQESGGNYKARNKDSGAMGKYQIMPANLGGKGSGWDYEALGRDVTPSQFMASPQIQEAVARYKLQSYYNKWGPAGAAVAWYAGPGAVKGYLKNPSKYTNPQGAYPSIAAYARMVGG